MEIDVSQDEGRVPVTVFRLQGDLAGEEPLQSQAQEAYEAGTRYLLLDLSKVPYITSAGLRAIHFVFDLMRGDAPEESDEVVRRGRSRHRRSTAPQDARSDRPRPRRVPVRTWQ